MGWFFSSHSSPSTEPLFNASLIPSSTHVLLPTGYSCRPLASADNEQFMRVLQVLTVAPHPGFVNWNKAFASIKADGKTFIIVILDQQKTVVGCGSLLVEQKFIRNMGKVGHIEDIAVAKNQQGKSLGKTIIHCLTGISEVQGCYKTILDCSEDNVPFYKKCNYTVAGVEMSKYASVNPAPSGGLKSKL